MSRPQAAFVEIVERTKFPQHSTGTVVPNEVRINGVPVLLAEDGLVIHEQKIPADSVVQVTLTLFARRVVIGHEQIEDDETKDDAR